MYKYMCTCTCTLYVHCCQCINLNTRTYSKPSVKYAIYAQIRLELFLSVYIDN